MASYSDAKSVHKTLTSTNVDDVTLTGGWPFVEVLNRGATGDLTVVWDNGSTPADPTALVSGSEVVPPGQALDIEADPGDGDFVCKIIGNAQAYSVTGHGG